MPWKIYKDAPETAGRKGRDSKLGGGWGLPPAVRDFGGGSRLRFDPDHKGHRSGADQLRASRAVQALIPAASKPEIGFVHVDGIHGVAIRHPVHPIIGGDRTVMKRGRLAMQLPRSQPCSA